MKRSRIVKALVVAAALPLLYLAEIAPDAPLGLTLVAEGHAVVGAPLTPLSVAGVEYQNCAGVYYRAAFQGNNLVYVVQ